MGVIAESIAAYAQPLIDETDGSDDQINSAFALAQVCWNLALLPEQGRDEAIAEMRPTLKMNDEEFQAFRDSVILPMIRRHQEMFPSMPRLSSMVPPGGPPALQPGTTTPARTPKYPGTGRNAPCPCKSGRKYKLCCGR